MTFFVSIDTVIPIAADTEEEAINQARVTFLGLLIMDREAAARGGLPALIWDVEEE